jgi:hypothetical protein
MLSKNLGHPFKPTHLLMSIRKVEWLWLSIDIASSLHGNLYLLRLAIRMVHSSAIVVLGKDSDSLGA